MEILKPPANSDWNCVYNCVACGAELRVHESDIKITDRGKDFFYGVVECPIKDCWGKQRFHRENVTLNQRTTWSLFYAAGF